MNNKIIFNGLYSYLYFHREIYRNPETQTNHWTMQSTCSLQPAVLCFGHGFWSRYRSKYDEEGITKRKTAAL